YQYQKAVEEGQQIVVGVNRFESEEGESPKSFQIDPALEQLQIDRLRKVRASRSKNEVCATLGHLDTAARSTENLMPRILDCCRAFVTVGEISDALRKVFGEYRETF